jgi:hypothetical protein
MNFFSGEVNRALPTIGRRTNEEILKIPTRNPISASLASNLERYIGMAGIRMQKTSEKTN